MSEVEFKNIVKKVICAVDIDMNDSIFESKYGLTETDVFYFIYYLTSKSLLSKEKLVRLLDSDDITFKSIYCLCF